MASVLEEGGGEGGFAGANFNYGVFFGKFAGFYDFLEDFLVLQEILAEGFFCGYQGRIALSGIFNSLRVDAKPLMILISSGFIVQRLARNFVSSAFALPPSGGAFRRNFKVPSSIFSTNSVFCERGMTLTCRYIKSPFYTCRGGFLNFFQISIIIIARMQGVRMKIQSLPVNGWVLKIV